MEHKVKAKLKKWFDSDRQSVLCLFGAPGVGKTGLALEFAKQYFGDFVYFNFSDDAVLRADTEHFLLNDTRDPISFLEDYYNVPEELKGRILFILDDYEDYEFISKEFTNRLIQHSGNHVILITVKKPENATAFECVEVIPLEFDDFLRNTGKTWYAEMIEGHFINRKKIPELLHKELLGLFRDYLLTGGMPEALLQYKEDPVQLSLIKKLRKINKYIESTLIKDKNGLKEQQILDQLPGQLCKDNKKFIFSNIRKGITYALYSDALNELIEKRIVIKLDRVVPELKNNATGFDQKEENAFRLYYLDAGLLNARISSEQVFRTVYKEKTLEEYKITDRLLIENILVAHLYNTSKNIGFWESESSANIDLLEIEESQTVPYNIKFMNDNRAKSISVFRSKYGVNESVMISSDNFNIENGVTNIPFYAIHCL